MISTGAICTSCSSSEISAGPLGGGTGYFTSNLEYGLRFAGFPIGSLTAQALFNYAATPTTNQALTERGITQTPQMQDNYGSPLLITIPAYDVVLANNFVGLSNQGSIKVDDQLQTLPYTVRKYYGSTVKLEAVGQSINSIEYGFIHWQDGSTTNPRTIASLTNNVNLTAYFSGTPSNYGKYLHNDINYGQPITLRWTDNPNTNVTQYQIWRTKKGGTSQVLLNTIGRGVQTYIDYDYILDNSYTHDLLWYDVREYYSTEGTYSPADWLAIYGEIAPKAALAYNSNINPSEIKEYSLACYPNPFNPITTINFQLPKDNFVTIKIFDITGNEIKTLVNQYCAKGSYNLKYDGSEFASGIYLYQIKTNDYITTKKMLLLK